MFRTQQNAFDDAVAKATDENLTSENWEFILDVCDKANAHESGAKDVVAALIKRLAHRNANVQLYTLELANALVQNCGVVVHRELSSRSFTDALLRLAGDRNTHQQVKARILEKMAEWTEIFSSNQDLGIMGEAYLRLKNQNPNLQPPSKPTKRQITQADRQKEEEELQMALELSVKDKQPQPSSATQRASQSTSAAPTSQQAAPSPSVPSGTTAATVSRVRALFDFQPSEPGELQFKKGDIIAVLESVYKDWWKGSLRGQVGIFPLNYVEKLSDPTPDELEREAQMESEVFGEIKNVEKLLTLLSTSSSDLNVRDNEEITQLYHQTLAIRPKLIELIGKYSQKKDDFTQLNEKFIKARRDYESLLEASMSQPAPSAYSRPGYPPYAGGGGYPPQGPPAGQTDPGRYYSPDPRDNRTPQPPHQPQYPPQNGPQPFYMSSQTPSQQPQAHHAPSYSNPDPRNPTPSSQRPSQPPQQQGPNPDPYHGHRPQSTYDNPQELGTYTSPQDRPGSYQQFPPSAQPQHAPPATAGGGYGAPLQQTQSNEYSPSVYSPDEPDSAHQPQGQAPTTVPTSHAPPQPSYAAPAIPPAGSRPTESQLPASLQRPYSSQYNAYPAKAPSPGPPGGQAPYPNLGGGAPPGGYQAYSQQAASGGAEGYYR